MHIIYNKSHFQGQAFDFLIICEIFVMRDDDDDSGLYPWDVLSGLAGMLQFCRQDKNCMDAAKKSQTPSKLQVALAN